jgi:hypothetical protein
VTDRLAYFEWSALPSADLDDAAAWAMANPALGIRIDEEFIHAERAALGDEEFARERLGIWGDPNKGGVFDRDVWGALADPGMTASGCLVLAVAVPPDRTATSLGVAGVSGDVKAVELVDYRSGTGWAADRVAEIVAAHGIATVVIDPGSPSGSLIPALETAGVVLTLVSTREYGQACGSFYDLVVEGGIRHIGQEQLDLAVLGARRRPLGEAWAWARRHPTVDISPLEAVTLAAWGTAAAPAAGNQDITQAIW